MYALLVLVCLGGNDAHCDYQQLGRFTATECDEKSEYAALHGPAVNAAGDRILGYLCQSEELVGK